MTTASATAPATSAFLRRPGRLLLLTLAGIVVLVLAGSALIVVSGLSDDIHPADVAIVPGNTVQPDGTPSARLRGRLDKAVELYRGGLFRHLIVSGGTGVEGFDEAAAMKRYLITQGIPAGDIIEDADGATTYLTARNAAATMRDSGWKSAIVISQYFHLPRTALALERFGVAEVHTAHADYTEARDIYSVPREVIGYCSYMLRSYE